MKNISTLLAPLFSVAFITASVGIGKAETLTPREALSRYRSSSGVFKAISKTAPDPYYTVSENGTPAAYLFSTGKEGFVLLSANDSSLPLLGFSDSGSLPADPSQLPPAFRYWMNSLGRQVAHNGTTRRTPARQASLGPEIAPLTATRWNQDLPYNYDCPVAGDRHCYTGCVATALAQILKYHNYPPKGTGQHSYNWKNPVTETDTTLTFDYANTEFNWDKLADTYDRDTPWDEKADVAQLMYACGVAVDMWYGLSGSGAATNRIAPAMIEYFGYNKGIRNYVRDYYGLEEWNQLVYDQLKEYGPVQYSGFADTDGHSFIIDGYKDEGYFHVNWGWGGMSDGYFLLTALDPIEQGIGGAESAFDFSQDFIGNVSSEAGGSIYEQILLSNAYGIDEAEAKPGEEIGMYGGSFSYSAGTIRNITFGAIMTPDDGGTPLYVVGPEYAELGQGDGVGPYKAKLPAEIPAGTYTIVPAFRNSNGEWQKIPVKVGFASSYTVVSTGDKLTFSQGAEASVRVENVEAPEQLYLRQQFEVTANIVNRSPDEFIGSLCVALYDIADPDMVMVRAESVSVDVLPGETQAFGYKSAFVPNDNELKSGKYNLVVCRLLNGKYIKLSEPVEVELTTGVKVEAGVTEAAPASGRYFTLAGIPLDKPAEKGLYIEVGKGVKARSH